MHRIVCGLALLVLSSLALAQGYPNKPVRVVLMYPPGGGADSLNRIIAEKISAALGQPVVIENRPGAGGVIAAEAVARAAPDGYTLLHAGPPIMTLTPALVAKIPYNPKDFLPVAALTLTQYLLLARPEFSASSLKEFIAAAKARPGQLSYGTWGQGSITHVAGEILSNRAGVELSAVPYKGEAPVIQDMLGGQIPLGWATLPIATQHIRSGKLKAIGIASAQRSALVPEVPTFIEQGLADFTLLGWSGIVAPAGTPREVVARLNSEINLALRDPGVAERLGKMGLDTIPSSVEQFGDLIRADLERLGPVLRTIAPRLR